MDTFEVSEPLVIPIVISSPSCTFLAEIEISLLTMETVTLPVSPVILIPPMYESATVYFNVFEALFNLAMYTVVSVTASVNGASNEPTGVTVMVLSPFSG